MKGSKANRNEADVLIKSNGSMKVRIDGIVYSEGYIKKFGNGEQMHILNQLHNTKPSKTTGVKVATNSKDTKDMTKAEFKEYVNSFNDHFQNSPTGETIDTNRNKGTSSTGYIPTRVEMVNSFNQCDTMTQGELLLAFSKIHSEKLYINR